MTALSRRQPWPAVHEAWIALRTRPRRALMSATGIMLAAAMLAAAIVVTDGLGAGFDRAARVANLGDLIVRFDPQPRQAVIRRIRALPDLAGFALRTEVRNLRIAFRSHHADSAVAEVVGGGTPRGYAVIAGRDLHGTTHAVLVEPGLAAAWGVHVGDEIYVRELGYERVVGLAEGPDDVGYPLAAARVYVTRASVDAASRVGWRHPLRNPRVNFAEIWLRNPRYLNQVLVQARDESFGLRDLQFATRSGVRVLVSQAAGIVIDLLVALSVIALITAAVMLAASARAEVQRRIRAIGIRRAVGATRGHVALTQALESALVALPAATIGTLAGWLATYHPDDRLLALLNEPGPGTALIVPLLGGWLASVAIPIAGAAWPAWSAAGRAVISLLRGADVARAHSQWRLRPRRMRGRSLGGVTELDQPRTVPRGGLARLGARLVCARRTRLAVTTVMLACSTAFVLLMVVLASALSSLETDPQELGKRYQLTDSLSPLQAALVTRIPGVAAAEPRYEVHAVDAYSLGEIVDVIAYPRDHTEFEAPPLAGGRRLRGEREAEVGVGLAQALGLAPGSRLLLQLPSDRQLSLIVSGTVSSLDDEGLVAYVPAQSLLAADPTAPSRLAIRLEPGADQAKVVSALTALGAAPVTAAGATARGAPLVAVLKVILRAVAIVDGLVCVYALAQACALTIQERRRTVAVLRAAGAGAGAVRRLLAGAALALLLPATLIGVALQWLILGPALADLAAGYATLELRPGIVDVLVTVAGLAAAGTLTVWWVARGAARESVVQGLSA